MKQDIAERRTPAGNGASIYDVARQADVSIVTVSRVFNDYPHVSQRMRQRVFAAARAVGYTPRLVSKPRVVAVIIGHLDHLSAGDYKTRLLLDLVRAAAGIGYLVEFIPLDSVDLATKHLVDAVVEVGLTDAEIAQLDHLPPVPTILINKQTPRPAWSTVSSDQSYEGELATAHLAEHGHRRIALLLDDSAGWGVEQRRKGYERVGRRIKGFQPLVLCTAEMTPAEVAGRMMKAGCTACVNLSDNFGLAVLDHCVHELGVRVPEDLSVVSLENRSVSCFWNPRLTTVEQPLQALAKAAIQGACDLLTDPARRFDRKFRSRLIERESVARR